MIDQHLNEIITQFTERAIMAAPPQIHQRKEDYFLAIPNMVQLCILKDYRRRYATDGNTGIEIHALFQGNLILKRMLGFNVIPGYENAVVIFPVDAMERGADSIYRQEFVTVIKHLP